MRNLVRSGYLRGRPDRRAISSVRSALRARVFKRSTLNLTLSFPSSLGGAHHCRQPAPSIVPHPNFAVRFPLIAIVVHAVPERTILDVQLVDDPLFLYLIYDRGPTAIFFL
jgi:hypothetical protein